MFPALFDGAGGRGVVRHVGCHTPSQTKPNQQSQTKPNQSKKYAISPADWFFVVSLWLVASQMTLRPSMVGPRPLHTTLTARAQSSASRGRPEPVTLTPRAPRPGTHIQEGDKSKARQPSYVDWHVAGAPRALSVHSRNVATAQKQAAQKEVSIHRDAPLRRQARTRAPTITRPEPQETEPHTPRAPRTEPQETEILTLSNAWPRSKAR